MEGVDRELRDRARPERFDVVAVGLALDHRAFAEPAAGRQARERDRDPLLAVVARLEQAVDDTEPVRDRAADPAQQLAGIDLHHFQVGERTLLLVRLEPVQPRDVGALEGIGRSGALAKLGGSR